MEEFCESALIEYTRIDDDLEGVEIYINFFTENEEYGSLLSAEDWENLYAELHGLQYQLNIAGENVLTYCYPLE